MRFSLIEFAKRLLNLEKKVKCIQCNYSSDTYLSTADMVGGTSAFTADDVTNTHVITHNAGFIPSYFSLTTTEPISSNHLNRIITFPDVNTMLITFSSAPNSSENANYVYVLYK